MKILYHHIYEYQKGLRNPVLCTVPDSDLQFAVNRLERQSIVYLARQASNDKINIFSA